VKEDKCGQVWNDRPSSDECKAFSWVSCAIKTFEDPYVHTFCINFVEEGLYRWRLEKGLPSWEQESVWKLGSDDMVSVPARMASHVKNSCIAPDAFSSAMMVSAVHERSVLERVMQRGCANGRAPRSAGVA
jgi:hypothetical protein